MPKPNRSSLNSITKGTETIYLTNKELLAELIRSKEAGKMSDTLVRMLQLLCLRYSKKGNFVGYCVSEDTEVLTTTGWVKFPALPLVS